MAFLTDQIPASGVPLNSWIHIVDPSDISQNPAGSSFKATIQQVISGYTGSTIYEVGTGTDSVQRIGTLSDSSGNCSVVSGGISNTVLGLAGFVGGGGFNTVSGDRSVITGGGGSCPVLGNKTLCNYNFIGGGIQNVVNGTFSSIVGGGSISGGNGNIINSCYSTIIGGFRNTINHDFSTVIGSNITTQSACTLHTNYLLLYNSPQTDDTNNNVLVRDVSTGVVKQRDITSTLNKNYASFYDTGDQTGLANTVLTMSANTSDSWNTGITLSANTRFVIQNPGVYSLAFSGQMVKTGGNTATHAHIWLYQNGLDVPNSASQIGFPSNSVYIVSAWNFFFSTTTPNEYVELKWEINSNVDNQLLLKHQPATGNVPVIPSLIVTINQVN